MKKIFLILVPIFMGATVNAQDLNPIPGSSDFKLLSNGWYKFQLESTVFDVEVLSGKLNQGNIKWFDGTTYSGQLNGTQISGKGTYTWPDGSRYEGAFKNHQRHGKGSQIAADGTKWSGKWKANTKNGKGKIFNSNGTVVKEGKWELDEMVSEKE